MSPAYGDTLMVSMFLEGRVQFKPLLLYGVMSLACWPYVNELICHLTGLILSPGGWHATFFSPANAGGRAILDADYPSMRQADMGYNVTSSRITPDLTSIIIPWYKRSFYERRCYQWCMMI